LCAGSPAAEKKDLFLDNWDSFFYLKQGKTGVIQGVDDAKEFVATQKALSIIGIPVTTQW
jgi:myosin-5